MEGYGQDIRTASALGAGIGVAGALRSATEAPQSPMQSVVQGLSERVSRLDSVVTEAHRRFGGVVRAEPPTVQTVDKMGPRPVRASSDLATAIDGLNSQLEALTARLASLVDRCEL